MAIIGTLPVNLTNGTTADASQVMTDLNFIVNQVNANSNPIGTLTAPSGTRAPFNQATAPLGWTTDTSTAMNDCSMRVNSGTGGNSQAGTTSWSGWNFGGAYGAGTVIQGFSLTIAQLPSHTHIDSGHTHADAGHAHNQNANTYYGLGGGTSFSTPGANAIENNIPQATAAAQANIQTSTANLQTTGSGAVIQPNLITPQVKVTDFIVAVKS